MMEHDSETPLIGQQPGVTAMTGQSKKSPETGRMPNAPIGESIKTCAIQEDSEDIECHKCAEYHSPDLTDHSSARKFLNVNIEPYTRTQTLENNCDALK